MASIWAGYRYSLLGFLLLDAIFVLIISAQNIETGRLVGGGEKSNIYTLIVSLFSAMFLAMVLWFDLIKRLSVVSEVRWELIWAAIIILFNIIGFVSIVSNKPATNTCNGPNSAWDICAASQGTLGLLALATIALIGHSCGLIVLVVRLSRTTEKSAWSLMAWGLPDAVQDASAPVNIPLPSRSPQDGMVDIDLGRPASRVLPSIPNAFGAESVSSGRRDLRFSPLLNPAPRELDFNKSEGRYQLHDAPVPIDRPPVARAFERVSGYLNDGVTPAPAGPSLTMYYAPTPVYDRFAGRSSEMVPSVPQPPSPRKIQKQDGKWVLADETDALERPPVGEESRLPRRYSSLRAQIQAPAAAQRGPARRLTLAPPRIPPGTLPNPNVYRPR